MRDTKELQEMEINTNRMKIILDFTIQFKWLFLGAGAAFILFKINALPHSFAELTKALKDLIPHLK